MQVNRKRVVITGMGVLSSIATNIAEFKEALLAKRCGIKPSEKYLAWFEHANASEVLQPLDWPELDPELIPSLDNAALWAYRVGREALINARLYDDTPLNRSLKTRTSLIIGVSSAGTEAYIPLMQHKMELFSLKKALVSGSFSSCSAIVSSLLGIKGGFELVATACTASTNAIGIAYDQIQNNKQNTALVIGTEPIYLPTFAGFYALKAMKTSPSSPFSDLPGMSIGEGAGALVLEEYEHALARGATIYGEIVSYATSCDAYHETAPDPRAEGATQVMQKALNNASLTPDHIQYINAHGTGTEANDRCETLAMKKVFPNIHAIPVSSTKSYVGHNIGSAGIIELIACFLTLPEKQILPTLNFGKPRANCDLNYVPNDFQQADVALFMKNNYAFGGNNCSVIANVKVSQPQHAVSRYQAKRVAITGVGIVSSLGLTYSAILEKLAPHKKSQQQPVTELHPLELDETARQDFWSVMKSLADNQEFSQFVNQSYANLDWEAELNRLGGVHKVKQDDVRKLLKRFDPRKANSISTFALVALTQALIDADKKIKRNGQDFGLILGMSKGPLSTVNKYLQSLFPDPTKVRTSEFPSSLMNAISTFCSISEGIKGYNTTLATGVNAGLGALTYGYELVRQSLQPNVIVGAADENMNKIGIYLESHLAPLQLTRDPQNFVVYGKKSNGYIPGEGAAMLLLEDLENAVARSATIHAEIVGYGKACDGCYFDRTALFDPNNQKQSQDQPKDKKQANDQSVVLADMQTEAPRDALQRAIKQALQEADIKPEQIDLICGSSDGTAYKDKIELGAITACFDEELAIPIVNYNGYFGLVESSIGLLNLSLVLEAMKQQTILPIPYTESFCSSRHNFVTQPLSKQINYALLLGASEGGNYYAIIVKSVEPDPHNAQDVRSE